MSESPLFNPSIKLLRFTYALKSIERLNSVSKLYPADVNAVATKLKSLSKNVDICCVKFKISLTVTLNSASTPNSNDSRSPSKLNTSKLSPLIPSINSLRLRDKSFV